MSPRLQLLPSPKLSPRERLRQFTLGEEAIHTSWPLHAKNPVILGCGRLSALAQKALSPELGELVVCCVVQTGVKYSNMCLECSEAEAMAEPEHRSLATKEVG